MSARRGKSAAPGVGQRSDMKPKRRVKADGWAELLTRRQPNGLDEFTLTCAHSSARSEAIAEVFSPDIILGLAVFLRGTLPRDASNNLIQIVAVRTLLARLLHASAGCSCGQTPYEVAEQLLEEGGGQ
jgi:hypothetical protein